MVPFGWGHITKKKTKLMAVAIYTTDLATINLSTGAWLEPTGATGGRITDNDPDNFIAGTNCTTSQARADGIQVGMYAPLITVTIPAGAAAFMWFYHGAMPTIGDFSANGYDAIVGSSGANYNRFTVHGKDTLPKGGWFNVAIDPLATPTSTVGTPTTTTNTFGSRCNQLLGVSKGNPYANDYFRYGRSIIIDEGEIANPATFLAAAETNDIVTNKWGLFENSAGGFSHKGLFQIGTVASAAFFEDSNVNIVIEDTLYCDGNFSEYEVIHTGTKLIWTGVQISALGTQSRGLFTATDNATIEITGCTFNDMLTFGFLSNSTIIGTVFRRCDLVTQAGSTITGNTFTASTSATSLLADNLTLVTGNSFVSDGSNHAVEITSIGGGSLDWNNQLSGYVAGAAGSPATTSSTGNEALYVNVGTGTLTVNVTAGASTPSIRTAGAIVNVIAGAVTTTITVQNTSGTAIENARVLVTAGATGAFPSNVTVTIASVTTTATVTHALHGLSNGDEVMITSAVENVYNGIQTISNVTANTYDYTIVSTTGTATGTIKSTFVFINGLSNISGQISDTRTYSVDQLIGGRVRKSTGSPYYKTGSIIGTINKDSGLSLTITMLSDE